MITNIATSMAVQIAQKRSGKLGSGVYSGRASKLVERNFFAFKTSNWLVILSGFVEPVFYLLAFGFGIGKLIGGVTDGNGHTVTYAQFIVPALLATSAMNGAIMDSTWNVFFKMHFGKIYQAMLATSLGSLDVALGEIAWALLRGLTYSIGFMCITVPLGLVPSAWGILAIPAATLIAFGFASMGMGITSYLKNFHQMDYLNFFMLPMFLFSGTFYPVSVFPEWIQIIVKALPLSQAVELVRGLTLGNLDIAMLGHVLYFVVMIVLGLVFTTRRLTALFMQ
jgi:lipooligosaccharide transport system permease protein